MNQNLLPDSRLRRATKGVIKILFGRWGMLNMVPVFCANCGKLGAYVPEENMTFACWLCDGPCSDQWGNLAGTYTSSDEEFWRKIAEEQAERYGRPLTQLEYQDAIDHPWTAMKLLLKESPIKTR